MRCAIYFVPHADDALTVAAARWLRRDIYTGARVNSRVEGLTEDDHAFLTALPRRYGFHATLKAPFRLAEGQTVHKLDRHLGRFCKQTPALTITMKIALIDSFFAFVPAGPEPELDILAARIVTEFDAFRSPLSEGDLARRNIARLNSRELSHLMNWGYPQVFDQFRWHMTLTGAIDALERDHVAQVLALHFGELAAATTEISQLVLAVEPEPLAPFIVHSSHWLSSEARRLMA